MSELLLEPDDTPKPARPPKDEPARRPGDYYYDDATGYEIYQPEEDDEDDENKGGSPTVREGAGKR